MGILSLFTKLFKQNNSELECLNQKINELQQIIIKYRQYESDSKEYYKKYIDKLSRDNSQELYKLNNELKNRDCEIKNLRSIIDTRGDNYNSDIHNVNKVEIKTLKNKIDELKNELKNSKQIEESNNELKIELKNRYKQIDELKNELLYKEDEIIDYGLYENIHDIDNCSSSELYMNDIMANTNSQKELINSDKSIIYNKNIVFYTDKKKSSKLIEDIKKLVIRSFTFECDIIISKIKTSNFNTASNKIRQSFNTINKLISLLHMKISSEFLNLKIVELSLYYKYELKKQAEKEEQKAIQEKIKEDAKLQKEIEDKLAKIQKEETHFKRANEELDKKFHLLKLEHDKYEHDLLEKQKMMEQENESNKNKIKEEYELMKLKMEELEIKNKHLQEEKDKMNNNLHKLEKDKEDVENIEKQAKAGYVYIISNIGSFGDNVYKIGMTRRLVPQDRIDELGDASVPFPFDVHAMIFSEDAPYLENEIHKHFDTKRVNLVNKRKEFFNVTLDEIKDIVNKKYNKVVQFTKLAEADQYRLSLNLKSELEKGTTK